jgi:hypothetical protein
MIVLSVSFILIPQKNCQTCGANLSPQIWTGQDDDCLLPFLLHHCKTKKKKKNYR